MQSLCFLLPRQRLLRAPLILLLALLSPALAADGPAPDPDVENDIKRAYSDYAQQFQAGNYAAASVHAARALELAESVYTSPNETLAILTFNRGLVLYRSGAVPESRDVLARALERYRDAYGDESAELIPVLMASGDAGVSEPAARGFYDDALTVAAEAYVEGSVDYFREMLLAGEGLLQVHRSKAASGYINDAYDGLRAAAAADPALLAKSAYLRGRMAMVLAKARPATLYLQEAVDAYATAGLVDTQPNVSAHALLVGAYERIGESDKATEHCLAVGRIASASGASEMMPLHRVAPRYPGNMLQAGRTGYVDLRLTVTPDGRTADIEVTGGENYKPFAKDATRAAAAFRYAPQFIDGEPTATAGVETRIRFEIAR